MNQFRAWGRGASNLSFDIQQCIFSGLTQSCGGVFRSLVFLYDVIRTPATRIARKTWWLGIRQFAKGRTLYLAVTASRLGHFLRVAGLHFLRSGSPFVELYGVHVRIAGGAAACAFAGCLS